MASEPFAQFINGFYWMTYRFRQWRDYLKYDDRHLWSFYHRQFWAHLNHQHASRNNTLTSAPWHKK